MDINVDPVEYLKQGMCDTINSRHAAADLLQQVVDMGRCGCFPDGVTGETLGRALFRICMNSPEPDVVQAIVQGLTAAESEFNTRLERTGR